MCRFGSRQRDLRARPCTGASSPPWVGIEVHPATHLDPSADFRASRTQIVSCSQRSRANSPLCRQAPPVSPPYVSAAALVEELREFTAARWVGELVSAHLIPRPHDEVEKMLPGTGA